VIVTDQKIVECPKEYADIQREGPMVDIIQIIPNAPRKVFRGTYLTHVSPYLCQSRDTGTHRETGHVVIDITRKAPCIVEHVWTGADDGHVAPQHVDELRQLVYTCTAKEPSQRGNARVILPCGLGIGIVVHPHGTELQASEYTSVLAMTFLAEQDGPWGGTFDGRSHDQENEEKERAEKNHGHQQIEAPFECQASRVQGQVVSFRAGHVP